MKNEAFSPVTNVEDTPVEGGGEAPWASRYQVLTPHMREAGGKLGVVLNRLPSGSLGCPFHWHAREDEVFYILEGRGVLRYGEETRELRPGDCISCPAGKQVAHQIGNPYDDDLVYLAMGNHDPDEICGYPDNGKVMLRHLQSVGRLDVLDYFEGEPESPILFTQASAKDGSSNE